MTENIKEPQNTKRIIAGNLQYLMDVNQKNRKDVCSDLDIKYTTFCDWIKGETYPRIESLEKLAGYFGVQVGDFFVDVENLSDCSEERIMAYATRLQEIDLNIVNQLSDAQVKALLKAGIRIKHKSLEERIKEAGPQAIIASKELDWGERLEEELW